MQKKLGKKLLGIVLNLAQRDHETQFFVVPRSHVEAVRRKPLYIRYDGILFSAELAGELNVLLR